MRRSSMRASEADRAQVADRLRRAVDEGRLATYEFDDRLGRALNARTYGELDAVVADLPLDLDLVPATRPGTTLQRRRSAVIAAAAGASAAAAAAGVILFGSFSTASVRTTNAHAPIAKVANPSVSSIGNGVYTIPTPAAATVAVPRHAK